MPAINSIKNLIDLSSGLFEPFLSTHAATANYLVPPIAEQRGSRPSDRTFVDNESIWRAIIEKDLRRSDVNVVLDGFGLFEWFPRSPGLFHTPYAAKQRSQAENFIDSIENGVTIYGPNGKVSMLNGGIGNIRLKPIEIKEQLYYLMTASSSGYCHEGFPVALPADLYNKYIDEITSRGAKICNVSGKLQFIPDDLVNLYRDYRNVPQLYLKVEEIIDSPPEYFMMKLEGDYPIAASVPPFMASDEQALKEALWVSVAVSFRSNFEGSDNIYATYVTFPPGVRGAFQEAVEWMEQDYIIRRYEGQVITDFDQQQSNFINAPFSLEKVMNLTLSESEIHSIRGTSHLGAEGYIAHQKTIIKIQKIEGDLHMGDNYINEGNAGAFGRGAQAQNFTQNVAPKPIPTDFAGQIAFLRETLKNELQREESAGNDTSDHEEAIGILAKAKKAVDEGDESKAKGYLASAGSWLLDFGTKVGVSLVTEVIKQQTGLSK